MLKRNSLVHLGKTKATLVCKYFQLQVPVLDFGSV